MTTKITRFIQSGTDLHKFFNTTKNFNKKFYKKTMHHKTEKDPDVLVRLQIDAIAISRDLLYKICWQIPCDRWVDDSDLENTRTYPIPIDEGFRDWLYPLADECGGHRWNCFERNDFIESDLIEEI